MGLDKALLLCFKSCPRHSDRAVQTLASVPVSAVQPPHGDGQQVAATNLIFQIKTGGELPPSSTCRQQGKDRANHSGPFQVQAGCKSLCSQHHSCKAAPSVLQQWVEAGMPQGDTGKCSK